MKSSVWCLGSLMGLVILQLCSLGSHAACFISRPKIEIKDGQTHTYCEDDGILYEVGSAFKIPSNCLECSCDKSGLRCCGYGIAAGVIVPAMGCKMISHGCTPYIVKEEDETKDCETGGPIKPMGK